MITIKKVLVPVDFSESAHKAILYGASFSQQYKAKLMLLSVVDDRVFEDVSFIDETSFIGYAEHEIRETRKKVLQEKIERIIEDIKKKSGKLEVEGEVRFGFPYDTIIKFAQEEEIDMIVMGSHGTAGIKHFLLGSTTEKVIRKAPCPVLAVRTIEREFIEES